MRLRSLSRAQYRPSVASEYVHLLSIAFASASVDRCICYACVSSHHGRRSAIPFILFARGALNLLGILNNALGQGDLGVYLLRMGVSASRAAGAILFIIIVHIGMILLVGSLGLLMNGQMGLLPFEPSCIGYGLAVGMMLYLMMVYLRPRFMQRYKILAPLQEVGLSGHL